MIVKHTKLRKPDDKALTLGKNYIVLIVDTEPNEQYPTICVRCDDDGTPAVFSLEFFDVVDPSIPTNWGWYELDSGIKGCYRLQPDEFSGDFWDDYHDVFKSSRSLP
ncbi:MAG: hypothetical protein CSA42_05775 [Gammaproteobacteria bacterium]|nr:MAG: hypothetical protein CSA42_05775 [Gammaproteobacteria bacterium]